ncbi:hypothetical protein L6E12_03325 [Actinokineospora sp. PR83]|uniref:hypothetical protein n=1 Tax=Actinokineospora sp. PR83 TaxID=2884908 RepID=UPI001F3D24E1|nr:hypothetical protein [Actinokineospora sp. PR83]MCG8914823.1 hypothetical protein [Actinokineospora sp. PR83]
MARSAFSIYQLWVAPTRKPDDPVNMSNIDGNGTDFLSLFNAFLTDIKARPLVKPKYSLYLDVQYLASAGRMIEMEIEHGRYGLEGKVVDVKSGSTTKNIGIDESTVTNTRSLIVTSENAPHALFMGEKYGSQTSATKLLSAFKRSFSDRFHADHLVFHYNSLMDETAWQKYLETAQMQSIEVHKTQTSSDIADGIVRNSIGRIVCTVKPRRGEGSFARTLRDRILNGDLKAQTIIGVASHDDDEVEIVLDNGTQQRRLIIGSADVPVLFYPLSDDGQPRPLNGDVFKEMRSKVLEIAPIIGMSLPSDWDSRPWTRQQRSVKLAANRGN